MSATISSQLSAVGAEIDRAFAEQARTIRELGEELAKTKQERDRFHQQAIRATSELKALRERFEDATAVAPRPYPYPPGSVGARVVGGALDKPSDAALFVRTVQVGDVVREHGSRYEYTVNAVLDHNVAVMGRGGVRGTCGAPKGAWPTAITPTWDGPFTDASTGERVYMPWEARAANGNDEGRSAAE